MPTIPSRLFAVAAVTAGLHGAVAVAMGAYSAHGMAGRFPAEAVAWVQTASTYQLVHAAALAGVGAAAASAGRRPVRLMLGFAVLAFALGALMFSGTLYGLAFADLHRLGPLAPIGGVALIVGWLAVAAAGAASFRGTGGMDGIERSPPRG